MVEIWRHIAGYEGLYKISSTGRVRRVGKPDCLKYGTNKQGRLSVTLCKDGVPIRYQVHRLVLEAFVGPCPPGMECRHGDGDHLNNRIGNLSWGTHTENMQDKVQHGTQTRGEDSPNAKLTEDQVRAIRAATGTLRGIGKQYGVSGATVHFIRARKTWNHVQ